MCSISGFVSDKPLDSRTALNLASALLFYGAERGEQSAGAYVNGKVFKKAVSPSEFIDLPEFAALFSKAPTIGLFHTRQPTCGDRGDKQAQPFVAGDTVSIHNGFFPGMKALKDRWKLKKKSGVDSELIARFVEGYGVKQLPTFLEDAFGPAACAVLWQGDVYLIRSGNPISVVFTTLAGAKVAIFGSTADIVENALRFQWLTTQLARPMKEGVLFALQPSAIIPLSEPMDELLSWHGARPSYGKSFGKIPTTYSAKPYVPGEFDKYTDNGWIHRDGKWRKLDKQARKELRRKIASGKGVTPPDSRSGNAA